MAKLDSANTARLNFRLQHEHKELIRQAALLSGQTITEYAISTLVKNAEKTLHDHEVRRLSNRDRDIFLAMLDTEDNPNESLLEAVAKYKATISE